MTRGRHGSVNAQNEGSGISAQFGQYIAYQGGSQIFQLIRQLSEQLGNLEMTMEEKSYNTLMILKAIMIQVVSLTVSFGVFKATAALMAIPGGAFLAAFVSAGAGLAVSASGQAFSGIFA